MSVKKAIDGVEGVNTSNVALGTAKVVYDDTKTNRDTIANAIKNTGYKITE
jgi:copper chaperone CopZ